jgi:hypothetical protein
MRPTGTAALIGALLGLLATAPAAFGQSAIEQYQTTGRIDPCKLTGGSGDIPNDVAQYAPDFLDALRAAQREGCNRNVSTTRPTETEEGVPVASDGAPLPPGATFVPKPPAPPKVSGARKAVVRHAPVSIDGDTTTPAPIVALAIMLLLAAVGGALAMTARYMGWGLDRLDPLRHAFGEARVRLGDAFSGLAERLRALVRRGA